ncbi:sigma-70 family RNA polymerase sigma factor [Nonomuraea spiralis]|uniref:Sigma-70 family RNA polymerase sigma factor n=1 Tax=Nonomuraea spiralis TaxID=46182 RepID=A0ABV5IJL2_9ACTN|nr:sigma-70 family RNA polymerase sigma factor [Nonomuraea spiralis]
MMADARGQEFANFAKEARPMLRRVAYRLSDDWHEADDLVQRTLLALHRRWDDLDRRDRAEAYARQIMRRLLISDRRSMRWSREVLSGAPPDAVSALDPYDLVGERIVLMDALARLGPRQRATIFFRFWEGRSAEDTARVMGNESSTVRSQTVRALTTLRAALARTGPTDRTDRTPT